jgi:predicted aspartyl protease
MLPSRRQAAAGLIGVALLPFSAAWAQPIPEPPAEATDPEEPATRVDTGADGFEHMLAPVSINGQGPFHFLMDTGANVSCISRDLANRLMLVDGPPRRVHTMVGVRDRPSVMIDHLQVGERSRKAVSAPSLSLNADGVDGILGVDWLKGQRLTMRFQAKSLEITKSQPEKESPDTVIVPARRRLGQLTIVDADLNGRQISAMVDSGAQTTICNTALRDLVAAAETRRGDIITHELVRLETIAGEPFTGEMLYLPFLRLGGLRMGNVPVVYADMHVFDLWGLQKTPAIVLGMDLLTQFSTVALDFGRSRVRFEMLQRTQAA